MKNVLVTGSSGYVGAILCDLLLKDDSIDRVIGIDKEEKNSLLENHPNINKFVFIHMNLADKTWLDEIRKYRCDVVIHTAWQIREMYGAKNLQWAWNVDGSNNVFDYVLKHNIPKLIYFSTVASYGAFKENTIDHFYKETEKFRKTDYLYAEEKRIAEENLEKKYAEAKRAGYKGQVVIIRPAAITGPRGRVGRIRFGLQSALSGSLKGQKSFFYSLITAMVSFVPVTEKWLRQFVHEDDITNIVVDFVHKDYDFSYKAFNIAPPGPVVLGPDMAKAVNKKTIRVSPYLIRIAFFFMWHLSMGKVPTSRGAWKGYSYPIAVDGSELIRVTGYHYKYNSVEAFSNHEGRYADLYKK